MTLVKLWELHGLHLLFKLSFLSCTINVLQERRGIMGERDVVVVGISPVLSFVSKHFPTEKLKVSNYLSKGVRCVISHVK